MGLEVKVVLDRVAAMVEKAMPALALGSYWLLVLPPLMQPGMITHSQDGPLHFLRVSQLDMLVQQGILWPRWSPGMVFGYGYPLFNFYPILTLYPVLIFHHMGLSLLQGWNLSLALSVLTSGLTMYLWARQVMARRGAFVAAVAYMLAPYQLYDVYWRGTLTESLTLPLLPLILWTALRVAQERRWRYALVGALGYATLLLMHAPASLIFTLVLLPYLLMLILKAQDRCTVIPQLAGILLLGLGLAAFFLLPAYIEKSQVQFWRAIASSDTANFRNNFMSLPELFREGGRDGHWFLYDPFPPPSLGVVTPLLAAIGVLATGWWRTRIDKTHRYHFIWASLTLIGVIVMMLPISAPVWSHTPLLNSVLPFIQYPMRFLGVGSLLTSLLAGGSVAVLDVAAEKLGGQSWVSKAGLALTGFCVVALALNVFPWIYPRWWPMPANPDQSFFTQFEIRSGYVGTTTSGEYLPVAVEEFPTTSPLVESLLAGQPVMRWDAPGARVLKASDDGLSAELVLESDVPVTATYRAYYFPGWQARLDGRLVPLTIVPSSGLMAVQTPAGRHTLEVHFGGTPLRMVSEIISLIAAIAVVFIGWVDRHSRFSPAATVPGRPVRPAVWLGLAAVGIALLAFKVGVFDRYDTELRWWLRLQDRVERHFSAPAVPHQVNVRLGNWVMLTGFDAPERAMPGQPISVTLVWQALAPTNLTYKVGVYLLDANGQLIAQSDAVPSDWARPTFGWQTGEFVLDVHTLELKPDLPPGEYRLMTAMYDVNIRRLPITGGPVTGSGDLIELSQVHVSAIK